LFLEKIYSWLPASLRNLIRNCLFVLWQSKIQRFYRQIIPLNGLIFDIGANVGDYTDIFSKIGRQVVACEPQPQCFARLTKRFYSRSNIILLNQGVGPNPGHQTLFIASKHNPNSTFSQEFIHHSRYHQRHWDQTVEVKMITLKQLIKQSGQPDYVKIDVEGYESEVLSTLTQPLPLISFEFLSEFQPKTIKLIRFLESLGPHQYNLSLFLNFKFYFPQWVNASQLINLLQTHSQSNQWTGDIYARPKGSKS